MNIKKIIYQLSDIKHNAESFTTKDGDDEIWRADIKVCEELIALLSEMQNAGINSTKEVYKLIKCYAKRKKVMPHGNSNR